MSTAKEIIGQIRAKNFSAAKDSIHAVIRDKVIDKINALRRAVSQKLYK